MKKSIFTFSMMLIMSINIFAQTWQNKIDSRLNIYDGTTEKFEFLVQLTSQADVSQSKFLTDKTAKGKLVMEQLRANAQKTQADGSAFDVYYQGQLQGSVAWQLIGDHNVHNGLMAIAAAHNVGVTTQVAIDSLRDFVNVKRRMEIKGEVANITIYDDFAHHPTAIKTTVEGLKAKVGVQRILAILEPRSNTMKLGIHKDQLTDSWAKADEVFIFEPASLSWSIDDVTRDSIAPVHTYQDVDKLVDAVIKEAQPSDHILVMSNGGFGGIHQKLLDTLA